jgi:hypothetical protein
VLSGAHAQAACARAGAPGIIEGQGRQRDPGSGPVMVEAVLRRGHRGEAGRLAAAAAEYAARGWPVCPGAHPRGHPGRPWRAGRARDTGRACSCDRVGCPAPGAHPISPAWQIEATADPAEAARIWRDHPQASIILVTGRVFDVLDVPARPGALALARLGAAGIPPGPVALTGDGRALFFTATRGAPADEDEWWSCHLDCVPGSVPPGAGLRWHCRDSYVVGPPSRSVSGAVAHWVRPPGLPLPDPLRLLELLTDVCGGA